MVILGLLLSVLQAGASSDRLPAFDDYRVTEVYKGAAAPVDLRSYPGARRFRTRLTEGGAKGPNFAGRFTVVTWGCGTSCEQVAIIDAVTGKVHFPLRRGISNGICFRLGSSLLITDPIDRETLEGWEGRLPAWLKTRYYKWDGSHLVQIAITTSAMPNTCDERWKGMPGSKR
jgi:hypothetical protein